MLAPINADKNLSEKRMEENDVLRTVDGLRGRLVAERAISRAAKDDAELMENKVMQLENKLKEETKSKNKSERKLKLLVKKLESLKINYILEESEQNSSATSASFGVKDPEGDMQCKSQVSDTMEFKLEENPKHIVADNIITVENDSSFSSVQISRSPSTSNSNSNSDQKDASVEENKDIKPRPSSLKSVNGEDDKGEDEFIDNSMALVLVPQSLQVASSENGDKPEIVINKSVSEVLDVLRHAREQIQRTLEGRHRHMFKVGSINTHVC